jgi:hypothetical protein
MRRGFTGIKLLLFLYLLPCNRISSRDSCSSSRVSSGGGRSSPSKGSFGSLPLRRRRVLWCWCPLWYQNYTNSLAPTSWKDSWPCDKEEATFGGGSARSQRLTLVEVTWPPNSSLWPSTAHLILVINVLPHSDSEAPFGGDRPSQYTTYSRPVYNVVQ